MRSSNKDSQQGSGVQKSGSKVVGNSRLSARCPEFLCSDSIWITQSDGLRHEREEQVKQGAELGERQATR